MTDTPTPDTPPPGLVVTPAYPFPSRLADILDTLTDEHRLSTPTRTTISRLLRAIPDPTKLDDILTITQGIMDLRDRTNDPEDTYEPVTLPPHLVRSLNTLLRTLLDAQVPPA